MKLKMPSYYNLPLRIRAALCCLRGEAVVLNTRFECSADGLVKITPLNANAKMLFARNIIWNHPNNPAPSPRIWIGNLHVN